MENVKNSNGRIYEVLARANDYSLVVMLLRHKHPVSPYVVAWAVNVNEAGEISWGQGHYFASYKNAAACFAGYLEEFAARDRYEKENDC